MKNLEETNSAENLLMKIDLLLKIYLKIKDFLFEESYQDLFYWRIKEEASWVWG